jgi:hypothetical protein
VHQPCWYCAIQLDELCDRLKRVVDGPTVASGRRARIVDDQTDFQTRSLSDDFLYRARARQVDRECSDIPTGRGSSAALPPIHQPGERRGPSQDPAPLPQSPKR